VPGRALPVDTLVMTRLHYPPDRLLPDLLRSAAGLGICLALILFTAPASVIFYPVVGLAVLLFWLICHTLWRWRVSFEIDDRGVTRHGGLNLGFWLKSQPVSLPWEQVNHVRLRYYSTRRDRDNGWMTVLLSGDGKTLRADSNLQDFDLLARAAWRAARRNGAKIDPLTQMNATRLFGDGDA